MEITRIQLELWMEEPVTLAYLETLKRAHAFSEKKTADFVGDPSNSDYTHAMINRDIGYRMALDDVYDIDEIMDKFETLEEEDDTDETTD